MGQLDERPERQIGSRDLVLQFLRSITDLAGLHSAKALHRDGFAEARWMAIASAKANLARDGSEISFPSFRLRMVMRRASEIDIALADHGKLGGRQPVNSAAR